ncbi:LPXTG cell wall anchor domain-containing protein [Rhodococcus sp. KBS0724]|uniref:LPXTG cell wall anchor domain-containing protein n=1 Tax=Rhodococcus sp. KBS0724 TaxID=1179674 RepID=UPI00110F33E5|nr:LPXTG cell wall anchor domain-containing protein [Rhodococcus sp. KBS0724]TSD48150.1 LPXTG cell wall anchor domain-containing protein [Rhodococcus sp. KBS0724]
MKNQRGRTKIYAAAVAVASFTAFAGAAPAAATDDDNGEATTAQTTAESPTTTESATPSESAPATTPATSSATSETTTTATATTTAGTTTPSVAAKSTPAWNSPTDGIAAGGREYSVSPGTVTVYYPDGQSAAMGQHINLTIKNPDTGATMQLGTHIDGNGQWTEKYIGQSPWVLDISSHPNFPGWENFEIVWVQVDGQNYHYGEHGEPPMPSDLKTPETTTSTTTPATTTPATTTPVTTTPDTTTTVPDGPTPPTTTAVATTTDTTEPTTTTSPPVTISSAVSTPSATSIPTTTTRVILIPPIIVGIPKSDGATPAPTTGPSKERVYVVTTPEGYKVHGYDDPQGTFVPLAYDDALVFQTGASESTGPSGVVIAGIGGAALLVSAAGAFALRRKNALRRH